MGKYTMSRELKIVSLDGTNTLVTTPHIDIAKQKFYEHITTVENTHVFNGTKTQEEVTKLIDGIKMLCDKDMDFFNTYLCEYGFQEIQKKIW